MKQTPFRPIELLRQIESEFLPLAAAAQAPFEALANLGCNTPRLGDPEALLRLIRELLGPVPFQDAGGQDAGMQGTGSRRLDEGLNLRLSTGPGRPLVIELSPARLPLSGEVARQLQALGGEVLAAARPGGVKLSLPLAEADPGPDSPPLRRSRTSPPFGGCAC